MKLNFCDDVGRIPLNTLITLVNYAYQHEYTAKESNVASNVGTIFIYPCFLGKPYWYDNSKPVPDGHSSVGNSIIPFCKAAVIIRYEILHDQCTLKIYGELDRNTRTYLFRYQDMESAIYESTELVRALLNQHAEYMGNRQLMETSDGSGCDSS